MYFLNLSFPAPVFRPHLSLKQHCAPDPLSEVQLLSQRQFSSAGAQVIPENIQQHSQLGSSKVAGFSPSGFSCTCSAAAGALANFVICFANIYFHTNQHMWFEVSFHILGSNIVSYKMSAKKEGISKATNSQDKNTLTKISLYKQGMYEKE